MYFPELNPQIEIPYERYYSFLCTSTILNIYMQQYTLSCRFCIYHIGCDSLWSGRFPVTGGSAPGFHIRFGHKLNGTLHVMFLWFCTFRIPMLPIINVSCNSFRGINDILREPHVIVAYILNIRRTSLSLIYKMMFAEPCIGYMAKDWLNYWRRVKNMTWTEPKTAGNTLLMRFAGIRKEICLFDIQVCVMKVN